MRTEYQLAAKYINFSLNDSYIKEHESGNHAQVSVGSSIAFFDIYNYADRMNAEPTGYQFERHEEKYLDIFAYWPRDIGQPESSGIGSTSFFVGYKSFQRAIESTSKAMLISILDGDSKRTANVGIASTVARLNIFHNTLKLRDNRDKTLKPWNNWNDSVGICTPTSISRINHVAIVTTTPAHGMSTAFDDWGVIMNLNTGIATSFNISTSIYPNGIPIKIIDDNTFHYRNAGVNTSINSVTGTADIQVGWGGTSNNLHLYIY